MPNYNDAQGSPTSSPNSTGKLEQDSHDGQTPEREDERADGDAEH